MELERVFSSCPTSGRHKLAHVCHDRSNSRVRRYRVRVEQHYDERDRCQRDHRPDRVDRDHWYDRSDRADRCYRADR